MRHVFYFDRKTQKVEEEAIYGHALVDLLYGGKFSKTIISKILLAFLVRLSWFSRWYGWLQKRPSSRLKIAPFIQKYHVCKEIFIEPEGGFCSFNDFFIRKIKKEARPLYGDKRHVVLPADGRYLVFPNLCETSHFFVKGQKLVLKELVQDEALVKRYCGGSLVFARLCPTDYHRFHFPCQCTPGESKLINGYYYSVNPIALRHNIRILSQNKRMLTLLHTEAFKTIAYIEVGASAVASICQTYTPHQLYDKGEEKGYFQFGGSCVLMLFEKESVIFDHDLLEASEKGLEMKAEMGQSLGQMFCR